MLDMRSVFVVQILSLLVCFIILLITWRQNRKRYNGLSCWASMMGFACGGYFLLALRDIAPDFISIIVANLFIVIAFALFNRGISKFYRIPDSDVPSLILIFIVLLLQLYFTYINPDINARIIVISLAFVLLYGQALWSLLFRINQKQRAISKTMIWTTAGIVLLNVYRAAIHVILSPTETGLFQQGTLDDIFLILQVPFMLFLVFNLVMIVSNFLMNEVKDKEAKFNSIFHSAPYAAVISSLEDSRVIEANDEMLKLIEYSSEELIGNTLLERGIWVDQNQRTELIEDLKAGVVVSGREYKFKSKSGKVYPVLFSASILKLDGKDYIVSTMKDISEIHRLKNELEEFASHDMLTGLPNRRKFDEICAIQLARATRSGEKLAMVMFDIDDFKCVNDDFGHDVGDKVLVAISQRLREFSRSADNIARHGGDEFTILLNGLAGKEEAEAALMRLFKLYEAPILVGGLSFSIGLSMGVAMYPENGLSTEELLKKADQALYVAKRKGKNSIWFAAESD